MRTRRGYRGSWRPASIGLAGLLLALWLQVTILASSPGLHAILHPDAAGSHHNCVITLVTQGQLLPAGLPVPAVEPIIAGQTPVVFVHPIVLPPVPRRLAPSRAPPPAVSSPMLVG